MDGIFRPPESSGWGHRGLRSLITWAVGSARLGPDHLQGHGFSKEAEPLPRATQHIWLLSQGGDRGRSSSLT